MNQFPTVLSDNNPVPCAISGTKEQFENAIEAFLKCAPVTENGSPHLSDMHCVQQLKFPAKSTCIEHGQPGWREAKLIHFAHFACKQRLRSEVMREWMDRPKTVRFIGIGGPEIDKSVLGIVDSSGWEKMATPTDFTVKELIGGLVHHSTKDAMAKGRIVKQLRAAKLIK